MPRIAAFIGAIPYATFLPARLKLRAFCLRFLFFQGLSAHKAYARAFEKRVNGKYFRYGDFLHVSMRISSGYQFLRVFACKESERRVGRKRRLQKIGRTIVSYGTSRRRDNRLRLSFRIQISAKKFVFNDSYAPSGRIERVRNGFGFPLGIFFFRRVVN